MMNMARSKAQENLEKTPAKTALMTRTMRSVAVKIILQASLTEEAKNVKRKRSKLRVEIRRSLRLNRVHCTIRKWPWMIEFS